MRCTSGLTFWKLKPPMYEMPSCFVFSIASTNVYLWNEYVVTPNRQPSFSCARVAGVSRALGSADAARSPSTNCVAPR